MKDSILQPTQNVRLPASFYQRDDVVRIARDLLGKYLVTCFDGQVSAGRIVETEAYSGPEDKACHAYGNRRTPRTETMFEAGGVAYVYLCYGIHHLFNVVTGNSGQAHAVLIRGLEPSDNIKLMLRLLNQTTLHSKLSAGPGTLSQALGICIKHKGESLILPDSQIWLEDRGAPIPEPEIGSSTRIGVSYAEEWAAKPWRFFIRGNTWVSKQR